jgi:dienelactone hydrolase
VASIIASDHTVVVTQVPYERGAPVELFRRAGIDDLVLDDELRPRLLFSRTARRDGRGLPYDEIQPLSVAGAQLGTSFLQPSWVSDRTAVPKVGTGPIHILGGGNLVGLGVIDDRGFVATWSPPRADATRLLAAPDGSIDAVGEDAERVVWHGFSAAGEDLSSVQTRLASNVEVVSRSPNDQTWGIRAWSGSTLPSYYLYRRATAQLIRLSKSPEHWAAVEPFVLTARDGLELSAYFTAPSPAGPQPWPLVLNVHGGPWHGRHHWEFDELTQRLAAAGFSVLSVNFRGSRGGGWAQAREAAFGREMINDVLDGLRWAVDSGRARADRIAVVGASYGGYAAIRLLREPSVRCAVAGLPKVSLMESNHIYNVESLAPLAWRVQNSPELHVDELRGPLLIWSAGRDGDDVSEISPFLRRAVQAGKSVTWVRFPQEGHGLRNRNNRVGLYRVMTTFLSECLTPERRTAAVDFGDAQVEVAADAEVVRFLPRTDPSRPVEPR